MTVRVIWHCDGCDKTVDMTRRPSSDWKQITVELTGCGGHPLPSDAEEPRTYEMCPECLKQLHYGMSPKRWPRPEAAA